MAHKQGEPFKVMEIFKTIQGEGVDIGRETIFLRLYGCNLSCVWCDTAHSWDKDLFYEGIYKQYTSLDITSVIEELSDTYGINAMVITGGEPLLHNHKDLINILGYLNLKNVITHVTFETNGTILPHKELTKVTKLFSVSPKLSSSQNRPFNPSLLGKWIDRVGDNFERLQFKFVIANQQDANEVAEMLVESGDERLQEVPIIFQPEESADNYSELVSLIGQAFKKFNLNKKDFNIRYIPQVHKIHGLR